MRTYLISTQFKINSIFNKVLSCFSPFVNIYCFTLTILSTAHSHTLQEKRSETHSSSKLSSSELGIEFVLNHEVGTDI